jgi:predicted metalloprotease with PDZ domain
MKNKSIADKHTELFERLNQLNEQGRLYGFMKDMYNVLNTSHRPFTEKMYNATIKGLERPEFDEVAYVKQKADAKELIEKVNLVYNLVTECDKDKSTHYQASYSALPFVESVKEQVEKKYWLSPKQKAGLNKVYNRYRKQQKKMDK